MTRTQFANPMRRLGRGRTGLGATLARQIRSSNRTGVRSELTLQTMARSAACATRSWHRPSAPEHQRDLRLCVDPGHLWRHPAQSPLAVPHRTRRITIAPITADSLSSPTLIRSLDLPACPRGSVVAGKDCPPCLGGARTEGPALPITHSALNDRSGSTDDARRAGT